FSGLPEGVKVTAFVAQDGNPWGFKAGTVVVWFWEGGGKGPTQILNLTNPVRIIADSPNSIQISSLDNGLIVTTTDASGTVIDEQRVAFLPPLPGEFLSQIPADKQYEITNGQVLVDGQVWFEINSAGEWEKIQRTISFDLEIGGTMEMFRFDTPKEGFEYMVNKDGIFWGEEDLTRTPEDSDFFMKKLAKISEIDRKFMSGIRLPNNIDSSKFQIMVYGAGDGTIIVYRADEGNLKAVFIDENASTVFAWIEQHGRSLILPKPQP
ncbi:MAG: hypothetical protein ABIL11_00755, partial [Chloroflexota bacterium]